MAGEHEEDFDFAGGPDEGYVDYAEGLGDEGEPGAKVGEGVGGVLRVEEVSLWSLVWGMFGDVRSGRG